MVLYHAVSTYQLLCFIVHKLTFHQQDKCIILVSHGIREKFPQYEHLSRFFDIVIHYKHFIIVGSQTYYSQENNKNIEKIFTNNKININELEEIHVGGAQCSFGAYLTENDIPCIYWEEASGLLSRSEILLNNEKSLPEKQKYCKEKGLYDGSSKNVTKRICNMDTQIEGFSDPLAEHFDVVQELCDMSEELRKQVCSFFTDIKCIDIPKNAVLLLTQHFANLRLMSFEDQVLLYQMLIDYFFTGENIIIKPHPDDIMYYGFLFPEFKIIREKFPSEFFPFIFSNKPKTIATISSTALFNLKKHFDNFFTMDFRYQNEFYCTHKYYTAVWLCMRLGIGFQRIQLIGADDILLKNLFDMQNVENKPEKNILSGTMYIVDNISESNGIERENIIELMEQLNDDDAIIFINSQEDYCFYDLGHKKYWDNIFPLCIHKKQLKTEEFYADTNEETIYFYSKDLGVLHMLDEFEYTKELAHTGLSVSLDKLSPEQKQIKILEGILAATEERLLYYMKLVENGENKK